MGVAQNRTVSRLRSLDRHGRLGVFGPSIPGMEGDKKMVVHAKVLIVDDAFLKIGSANLNNRSMGLDTECDLSIEAGERAEVGLAIARVRRRLLAEHNGVDPDEIARGEAEAGSLLKALQRGFGHARRLKPLVRKTPPHLRWLAYQHRIFDPEGTLARERLISDFLREEKNIQPERPYRGVALVVLFLLLWACAWERGWFAHVSEILRTHPYPSLWVLGLFLAGAACLVPTTILGVLVVATLGWEGGLVHGLVAIVAASHLQYAMGRLMPRRQVLRLVNRRLNSLTERLARLRALPDFLLRFLPIAPFAVMNLVSGASRMTLPHFFLLSVGGSVPFALSLSLFQLLLDLLARQAGPRVVALTLVLLAVVFLVTVTLHPRGRRVVRRGANV